LGKPRIEKVIKDVLKNLNINCRKCGGY
jgi:hypothetical protein